MRKGSCEASFQQYQKEIDLSTDYKIVQRAKVSPKHILRSGIDLIFFIFL
jgi:hypothetical protein